METLFQTGNLLTTHSIYQKMSESGNFSAFCHTCLEKHKIGDWGDLEEEDIDSNAEALSSNGRLFSCYKIPHKLDSNLDNKIYIITEWDRSATTILFPSEY